MSGPGAGLGRVAPLQGATAFPSLESQLQSLSGAHATSSVGCGQDHSRKPAELEEMPDDFEGWPERGGERPTSALRTSQQAAEAPSPNGLVFPGAENGTLLWTPKSLEPFTLEILARNVEVNLSSVLQPRTVVCACRDRSQCLYNQTGWVGNSSLEVSVRRRVGEKAVGTDAMSRWELCVLGTEAGEDSRPQPQATNLRV